MTSEDYQDLRDEWEYNHMMGCECDPDIYEGAGYECEYCDGEYWLDWDEWFQQFGGE